MDELKIINFLDAFSTNALSVLIPLLLVGRGVGVVEIGFIISMSPIIFVVSRSIFAAASDQVGVRRFFILNGLTNVIAVGAYMVANTPLLFSFGKMIEGVRNGAIWAVVRTAVIAKKGKRKAAEEMSKMQAERTAAAAMGIVAVGVLLSNYSFDIVLTFFLLLGFMLLGASFMVEGRSRSKVRMREIFGQLDFRKKSGLLKRTSLVMISYSVASMILLSLVFPIFLKEIGFDYWLIGLVIALFYTSSAATTFVVMEREWGEWILWVGALLFFAGAVLIPLLGGAWVIPLVLLMGVGDGVSTPVWEYIVFNALRSSRDYSSDVALLHTPPNICGAVGLILAGVAVSVFGYWFVFVLCGLLALLFFYSASSLLKEARYFW
jgi:predicted MFS family arabinose efflux permease